MLRTRGLLISGALLFLFLFLSAAHLQASSEAWTGLSQDDFEGCVYQERYEYRMKGSVRLLLFWIGKEGVGGGWISRLRSVDPASKNTVEAYEVLFGSDPDQVPGRRNRWGYAREIATWNGEKLRQTRFEGFMSKSSEESLSEVQTQETDSGGILFEIATSRVTDELARKEIRRFEADPAASYKSPDPVASEFERRLLESPPEEVQDLLNEAKAYSRPLARVSYASKH